MKRLEDVTLDRMEFLRLSAGIITGLGIPGVLTDFTRAADAGSSEGAVPGDSYLEKGLTAMVRAKGWFEAHWGAGVLAGYYLCRDNQLDEATVVGIKTQMDAVVRLRAAQFAPLPMERPDRGLIEQVAKALPLAMQGGLRAHGHAVIFASLSIRALRDVPHMAQPELVKGLCGLSTQIARIPPQRSDALKAYEDTQAMIEATFDSLARFKGLLGRPSIRRPNFTHMITHTEALMNLELMGYPELTKAGHSGHRIHVGAPLPESDSDPATDAAQDLPTLETVMSKDFWNDARNHEHWRRSQDLKDSPNGDWIAAGHLFKVLYSYHRLIGRIKDKEKVKLCSRILLERYINPEVQGG